MNKKIAPWLTVGAILIAILVLVYFFYYRGGPPQPVTRPGPPPGAPTVKPLAEIPAPQEVAPQKPPAAPSPEAAEEAAPAEEVAPGAEVTAPGPKVTVLPPLKAKEQYGVLVGKYKKYRDAGKMLGRLKKHGIPGFIKRKEPQRGPYEVWAGPFPTRSEAEAAEKSIRAMHRRTPKIHKIITPVPK
jgi:cell division septation protein DedD